ncbi:DUF4843 domain-containing protein [Pedobacter steynii]|uniref:DUF4843 domain-containing protein n=1 Tax=Pedobacter steynii TaxID=430522 RepID=A0A1D7QL05_9SPHI|nr:DUF4843 domain-containing protein [Pedobacter steynii]AOM79356.1 hypothetical protein BFS30_20590 [Pedobacter steynii]
MKTKYFICFLFAATLLVSCKEEEVPTFDAMPTAYFSTDQDSTYFTFALRSPRAQDTVSLTMRIMGQATGHDRPINVQPSSGTTAAENKDYKLLPTVLAAGKVDAAVKVVIYNLDKLKTETPRLYLEMQPNEHFVKVNVEGTTLNPARMRCLIKFDNRLEEPIYWPIVVRFFGPFSVTKFKFMMQVFGGKTDFNPGVGGGLTYADTRNYPLMLRTALAEYEAINGPLIDEKGIRVTF